MPVTDFGSDFNRDGYFLFSDFFSAAEVANLSCLILPAHEMWMRTNAKQAIVNSNYLTSVQYMPDHAVRREVFRFIASKKMLRVAERLCPRGVYFLNTQLFFNPTDPVREPYWHRDVQYLGVDEGAQQGIIKTDVVLHFRIPLAEDPGLEFIPGSHRRWDTPVERSVRLELGGHRNSEALPGMIQVPHKPGDLLLFSAHLIHRGSYGLERKSFDVLYTDFPEKAANVASFGHFPAADELALFERAEIFRTV